jgi:hypothetical protein
MARRRAWLGWSNARRSRHIPVFDKSNRTDGTDAPTPFPEVASQPRPQDSIALANWIATSANSKAQCCPNALARKIPRDLHEDARDVARAHAATPEYMAACRRRKKVEMLFAHLKRILRLTCLRLRGPNGAREEFLLAATAQNLRRHARLRPINMLPEMLAA